MDLLAECGLMGHQVIPDCQTVRFGYLVSSDSRKSGRRGGGYDFYSLLILYRNNPGTNHL